MMDKFINLTSSFDNLYKIYTDSLVVIQSNIEKIKVENEEHRRDIELIESNNPDEICKKILDMNQETLSYLETYQNLYRENKRLKEKLDELQAKTFPSIKQTMDLIEQMHLMFNLF